MIEKLKQPVCVSLLQMLNDMFPRGTVCTTMERMGKLWDDVFKDLVHAGTSVEASCLFLLVDCLPTS